MAMERKVELRSSDNVSFKVDLEVVKESQLIMDIIEATRDDTIFLSFVPSKILIKVIEYCNYHMQSKQSTDENPALTEEEIKQWDAAFVQVDHPTLLGLINAANYMNMMPLLELMCQRVVDLITGKRAEVIKKNFGIVNNFTQPREGGFKFKRPE